LPETNKLMRKAFMKYYDEINNLIAETTAIAEDVVEDVRKVISKLVHTISEEFLFLTVKTNDINQAYEIFETLNARGKELETADLLKNHLLMNAESRYKHNIQRNWDYIVDELISFKMNEVTRYIRYYWNSRYEFARERDLFRKLRTRYPARNVKEKENLVVNLKNYVTHYRNLIDEDYNGPYSANEVMKNAVLDLKQLGLLSHIPLILAISEQVDFFTDEDISKTMNYLINFMVRNIIIGKQTANRNEILFSSIAQRVSEGTIINVEGILSELQNNPNAITDDQFENLFNEYSTRNKNYIRYILRKFNNYLGKSALTLRSPNEVHIEHINPQTPRGESLADEKQYKDTLWRLGNLTFLLNSQNTSLSNKDYSEKKDSYRESELRITNIIPEQFDSWGYEQIFKRQRNMAKAARENWKL